MDKPTDGRITLQAAKKEYGLTPDLLALLPEPELKHQPGKTPLKLYRIADIEALLKTPEAQPLIERAKAKRVASVKANATKEEKKVLAEINSISCPRVNPRDIVNCADTPEDAKYLPHELLPIAGFEDYWSPSQPDPPLDDEEQKVALRLILQHLARYNHDYFIKGIAKDSPEPFRTYRYAVLDAISEVYPELKDVAEKRKTSFC